MRKYFYYIHKGSRSCKPYKLVSVKCSLLISLHTLFDHDNERTSGRETDVLLHLTYLIHEKKEKTQSLLRVDNKTVISV